MKRWAIPSLAALAIGVLALTMSAAPARADHIDFNFQNGSITSSNTGVVTGSVTSASAASLLLTVARNISPNTSLGPFGLAGTVTFTTGAFAGGAGTQASPFMWNSGGSITVTSGSSAQTINGTSIAANTLLFSGSFSNSESATVNGLASTATFTGPFVLGTVSSNLLTALGMSGSTNVAGSLGVNLAITSFSNGLPASANLSSGDLTVANTTPEPGTLALFGSGLLGIAGIARRYMLKSNS